jgi:hypothetical protein
MKKVMLMVAAILMALPVALVLPTRADAAQVSNVRVDFAFTTTNPCTGESVSLEGTTHFLANVTMDAGGGAHFVENSNTQGTGISASGAKYVLISTGEFVETPASDAALNLGGRASPRRKSIPRAARGSRAGEADPSLTWGHAVRRRVAGCSNW